MALILVTGANRGIGLEFACQYAEAGDRVIATCRDPESANALTHLRQSHENVEIQPLDVVDPVSILSLASLLAKRGDALDVFVNNAAICVQEDVGHWTAEALSATLETNVVGPALALQAFSKVMARGGKMINVSSGIGSFDLGIDVGGSIGAYSVSKAALNMAVRQMAPWLEGKGIVTVAISPGWVKTDMGGQEADLTPEESVNSLRAVIGRIGLEQSGSFLDKDGKPLAW